MPLAYEHDAVSYNLSDVIVVALYLHVPYGG